MNARQTKRLCTLEAVASLDNLFLAAHKARLAKTRRPDVEDWWLRREQEIIRLHEELRAGSYQPGPYHFFEIHDPKRRLIAAAPFRDRVVHHALCNVMAPVLERRFIARSFSCQVGKGTTAARECCRQLTNRFRYVLKCDVRKFFPNIDQEILFGKLAERIGNSDVLGLIRQILASYRTGPEVPPPLFPGNDWLATAERPRGVPIGNLTSQHWGNFYLDALDHWITETQRQGAYLRYTDDFLLFGDDKARLSVSVFAWYQFSREGNTEGLRRAYACWPLAARLQRRQRRTRRVLRGASWNNNDREVTACSFQVQCRYGASGGTQLLHGHDPKRPPPLGKPANPRL